MDAGLPDTDAGMDAGLPDADAGMDAGLPGADGGIPEPDGGTASRKPYVVFVVDRSATLIFPVDANDPDCQMADNSLCGTQGQDNCNPALCPTRLGTLKAELEQFLSSHATQARYGLAFFPATTTGSSTLEEACSSSSQMKVSPPTGDEPEDLQLSADAVLQAIQNLPAPAGSSPLGDTLEMVARETPLGSAAAMAGDLVVIVTDGPPNCNADNVNDSSNPALCRCTAFSCMGQLTRLGCLDLDVPVSLLNGLRSRGVRTYVLAVGDDTWMGQLPEVFNSLATAGDTARACPQGTSAECGDSDFCNPSTLLCGRRFLRSGELNRILAP
ncbi:vWA domain-containing protein [Hyalangium rubrum]|uniref:VWA domain-containing protein n=1 Tax=Hyalangium rubrum TaxID=3103134 RepID=A0ABU5H7X7_9BACT|nr:vWA domain-containing protein [Hyalangium sp. s54d21]MDY7229366.1 vWA domain-containing protein [Hyalangium sp. s54d21]